MSEFWTLVSLFERLRDSGLLAFPEDGEVNEEVLAEEVLELWQELRGVGAGVEAVVYLEEWAQSVAERNRREFQI